MGTYSVERITTSDKGAVIRLRQTGKQDPKKPELLDIYDKDNNGIDAGDRIARGYDFAYQLSSVYQKMVKTKRLPKTVNGERVVTTFDGGLLTKKKITRAEITRWKAKLNPYLAIARRHRKIVKARKIKVIKGDCLEAAPATAITGGIEVEAVFRPPLTLATRRPRKRRLFYSMSFMGNMKRLPRNPARCNQATGKTKVKFGNVAVTATISTRVALSALLLSSAFSSFKEGRKANISYYWKKAYTIEHINVR